MEPVLPASPALAQRWHLRLLDTVVLADPMGRLVPLPGRMAPLLLARLALAPRRPWPRDTLVALLWPDADPAVGRNRLRQLLSALGSALAPFGDSPLIQADRDSVGLRPGALRCDADDPRARGELLPGYQAEWVNDERRARERDEPVPAPAALPHPPTRWHGDPTVLLRLQSAVQTRRIVTLSGTGGSGKTRAALEVAHALHGHFDRIAWVALADCRTAAAMQERWLIALGLGGHSDAVGTLSAALAGRRVLLVLDNLEQIAVDAGPPLAQLVSRTPGLHLLLTSRCALDIDGETLFPWAGLGEPAARLPLAQLVRHPAMALLIDRAQAVRPGFRLEPANADTLVALLQRLGGLPLAIELAASRLRATDPSALLALLQDRSQATALLRRDGERNGHDARPASLMETMRWSWNLLSPPARAVLDAVSSFDGPFNAESAAALHGAQVTLALDELVRHSLLQFAPGPLPYTMHPLMRDDLRQALPPEATRRYSVRLRAWVQDWVRALPPSPPLGPLRRQLPLLAHAIASAEAEGMPQEAVSLFMALQRGLSDISLPRSTREVLARCIATLEDSDTRAVARAALARAALRAGDGAQAEPLATLALDELPDGGAARATVLTRVAHLRWRLHRDAGITPWLDEALALARVASDKALEGSVLSVQGAMCRGSDPASAAQLQRQAIDAWATAGDAHGVNTGRYNLALALGKQSHTRARALEEIDLVIDATQAAEDWGQLATAWNQRGEILRAERRWTEAAAAYRRSLRVADEALERLPLLYALWNLSLTLAHLRDAALAAVLMGHAAAAWAGALGRWTDEDRRDLTRVRRLAARQIGAERAARAWRDGEALPLGSVLRLALGGTLPP